MPAYSLPTSIQTTRASFNIRNQGDFRMVLDCFSALNDVELSESERLYSALMIFYEDFNSISDMPESETLAECVKQMFEFFNQGEELTSNTQNIKVIDWDKDSNLVASAINSVAGKDIRGVDYMHWWTFLSYFMAVGECPLATVTSIRYKTAKGKKLEENEKQYKRDNPQFFTTDLRTTEQKEADEYIRQLWGDG